ncbi:MAG: diaminopimelate epimerase [Sulfobacillus sp.]
MVDFTKMHGLGNDYLFIDIRGQAQRDDSEWSQLACAMSDRHFGVGSDGIILIDNPNTEAALAKMRIFNSDGSESEMCGNGLRAMAKWLYDRGQWQQEAGIETGAGVLYPEILETRAGLAHRIRVNMGQPRLNRAAMAMLGQPDASCFNEWLDIDGATVSMSCVSMGNPHAMIFGPLWDVETMAHRGPQIENHPVFQNRTNVHSVEILGPDRMRMRHWERGAGLTLACGTGVSAALVAAILTQGVSRRATVEVPGGELVAEWDESSGAVFLTGTAQEVFQGQYDPR